MKNLSEYTDQELKDELQKRGFHTSDLWSLGDVQQTLDDLNEDEGKEFKLSDAERMSILNDSVGDETSIASIYDSIRDKVREHFNID